MLVWQLNLNFTIKNCDLVGRLNTNSKRRVCCFPFIHAGNVSYARHMSRTRFERAQSYKTRPDTSEIRLDFWLCASVRHSLTLLVRQKHALNSFNISLTRQDKVYTSKISNESQRVGTLSFVFKTPGARLAHTPMCFSPIRAVTLIMKET